AQRLEPHLVERVGRVRDQLAKENVLVRVEGVDHQVQQLADLGLELVALDVVAHAPIMHREPGPRRWCGSSGFGGTPHDGHRSAPRPRLWLSGILCAKNAMRFRACVMFALDDYTRAASDGVVTVLDTAPRFGEEGTIHLTEGHHGTYVQGHRRGWPHP